MLISIRVAGSGGLWEKAPGRCKSTPIDGPPLFFRKRGWEPAESPASEKVSRVLLPGVESRDWASLATGR